MGSDKISTSLVESGLVKTRIGRTCQQVSLPFSGKPCVQTCKPRMQTGNPRMQTGNPHVRMKFPLLNMSVESLCIPLHVPIRQWNTYRNEKLTQMMH